MSYGYTPVVSYEYKELSVEDAVEALWELAYTDSKQEYLEKLAKRNIFLMRRVVAGQSV